MVVNPITGMKQRIVEQADLEHFAAQYVSLLALAKERGVHFPKLKAALDGARIPPAFDTAQVPARFYLRSELPPP